ncbi:hypothetical protein FCIRC_2417 [Fusarium circinatum]|uniref:Uncharacterized protein n=1 Tax=Fusarium circinatum TaxID=48490 RepID=A0A8H5XA21_FUSCI|nr:hypothetical protein FCIRC_2417 [Fusarium circinatum]
MDVDLAWTIILHAPGRNKRLTRAIINTTKQTGATTEAVKKLLKKIYDHITRLFKALSAHFDGDDSRPTDKLVLDTWRSFLQPIRALRKLPSCGEFVAARLLLFTGAAFLEEPGLSLSYNEETLVEETNPLHGFTAELDDALLEPLKKMWELSQFRERFDWVFTRFNANDYEMTEALALSPQELEDLDGIRGIKYYYLASDDANDADDADDSDESDDESDDDDESDEDDADELERYNLYTGPIPRWDCGEQDWDNLEWKRKGSDGPITGWLEYRIQEDELPDENFMNGFHIFRQSHQFCLDARQKSEAHIGRQQHQTFDEVARRRGLPPEMRNRILSYIEYRDPFPYLEKLDLAEAYVPFRPSRRHTNKREEAQKTLLCRQIPTTKLINNKVFPSMIYRSRNIRFGP